MNKILLKLNKFKYYFVYSKTYFYVKNYCLSIFLYIKWYAI